MNLIKGPKMKNQDFGYFKYVRLEDCTGWREFRFVEVTGSQSHTDLVNESEEQFVVSAGDIGILSQSWKLIKYGSQSLNTGSLVSDPELLTELLGRPQIF